MTELTKSIPKSFYVAINPHRRADEALGYLVDSTAKHTKGFITKQSKADSWAGIPSGTGIEFDNVPMSGFTIIDDVSRHSTSNVVWRIMHPMGFEFEIYSPNFLEIIKNCTIVHGVIQDELFLTTGKVLTGIGLPTYMNIESQDNKFEKYEGFKFGDIIRYQREYISKHGETIESYANTELFEYIGVIYEQRHSVESSYSDDISHNINKSLSKTNLLRKKDGTFKTKSDNEMKEFIIAETELKKGWNPTSSFSDALNEYNKLLPTLMLYEVKKFHSFYNIPALYALPKNTKKRNFVEEEVDKINTLYPTVGEYEGDKYLLGFFRIVNQNRSWYGSYDKYTVEPHHSCSDGSNVMALKITGSETAQELYDLKNNTSIEHFKPIKYTKVTNIKRYMIEEIK